jgi:hypothetical protein
MDTIDATDIDSGLRRLEARYRKALSRAVAVKAQYLALAGNPSATPAAIEHARLRWEFMQLRRRTLARHMALIETMGGVP